MSAVRSTLLAALAFAPPVAWGAQDIVNTVHNLSVSGPGTFKSLTVSEVCVFCHTPHSAQPDGPLWNRAMSGQTYLIYGSSTLQASPGQPSGRSRLCLSCHDGTVALGAIRNLPGDETMDLDTTFLTGRARVGTDLHDDHPVSFLFDAALAAADGELADPNALDLPLEDGFVQCTSCHDPHERDTRPFLRKPTTNAELCTTCHVRGGATWSWEQSSHATSPAGWTGAGSDPWGDRKPEWRGNTVAENACFNCHKPHTAATDQRLLKLVEEDTCYLCHAGTVASKNIQNEFFKAFRHPIEVTPNGDHDATLAEDPLLMNLHVECMDCHNPHAARDDLPMISFNPNDPLAPHAAAPEANGRIAGTSGISVSGVVKPEVDFQYELCFKCHGVPGRSACGTQRCPTPRSFQMTRLDGVYNIRDKVNPSNPSLVSYHPLVENNPDNNAEVPSLRTDIPLDRITSRIYCTDCHNSDASPAAGNAAGPLGPHGSTNGAILTQSYTFNPNLKDFVRDGQVELCFKCHSRASLESDQSGFLHERHFTRDHTCINCHDPHGSHRYEHLINFKTNAVFGGQSFPITGAGPFSEPTFIDGGRFRGTCFLNCHGEVHAPRCYNNGVGETDADCPN
jgi:predicted CXXCH cytochrome family protein